ncbi:MAG TPA: hypothetical protein VEP67_07485 [Thiobacillaceae bacterium]|nr:hypothetical protein [Thiobacillaceae bacterium]
MFKNYLRHLLNTLAFANVGNQSEFRRLLERSEHFGQHLPTAPATVTPLSQSRPKAGFMSIDSSRNFAKR